MTIPSRKEIGDKLQSLRVKAGFSSAEKFAEHIGINKDTYSGYEQGKGMFTYERAWKLADELQCSLDELGGRQWPPGGSGEPMTAEEKAIVDDYRRMDEDDRPGFVSTAHALAFAGDAKKEGAERPVVLDGRVGE